MSLALATLIPGLLLVVLGLPLVLATPGAASVLKRFPRSRFAAGVCFGAGAVWFLYNIWNLPSADFGDYRTALFFAFFVIAALAFKCVPDFLAVRGVCVLVLLGAMPLLDSAYMRYDIPRRLFMVSAVYLCIALALWLGAQPYRLRDFLEWLFARPGRARALGVLIAAYGLLLCAVSLSY
jgi:hypothetical protein